jgi:hypothetical protein
MTRTTLPTTLLLLLVTGCAKSLDPGDKDDTGTGSEVSAGEAVINATSESNWVYLDLESATMVTPATPEDSDEWDLGFRRYKVMLNGGVSGTGQMQAVPMPGVDYNTDLEEPTEGWITDEPDADGDGDMEYALDSWFDYDSDSHEVTPADTIFVLRTVEGGLLKFEFLGYYDDAGTPAYVHVHWGPLSDEFIEDTGDTTPDEVSCTADSSRLTTTESDGVFTTQAYTGDETELVCFDFASGGLVSDGWDMTMVKWTWPTTAEVAELEGEDFDALTVAPADGYVSDPDLEGDCFEDWYDYDSTEHILVPYDKVYVVHTDDDTYYKLQVLTYYPEGDHDLPHWPTWKWAPIDAPAR